MTTLYIIFVLALLWALCGFASQTIILFYWHYICAKMGYKVSKRNCIGHKFFHYSLGPFALIASIIYVCCARHEIVEVKEHHNGLKYEN